MEQLEVIVTKANKNINDYRTYYAFIQALLPNEQIAVLFKEFDDKSRSCDGVKLWHDSGRDLCNNSFIYALTPFMHDKNIISFMKLFHQLNSAVTNLDGEDLTIEFRRITLIYFSLRSKIIESIERITNLKFAA